MHAPGRAATRQFAPQHRRQGEADQVIECAPRQVSVDKFVIQVAGIGERVEDRIAGDLVENYPLDFDFVERLTSVEFLADMPGNGLALAIWVGGESAPALRRTARYGDTWYPIGSNPHFPLDTIERFTARVARLGEIASEEDRDPASISLVYCATWANEGAVKLDGGGRHLLTGLVQDLQEDMAALADAGVVGLMLNFQRDTLVQSLDAMQHFADEVRLGA